MAATTAASTTTAPQFLQVNGHPYAHAAAFLSSDSESAAF